MVCISLRSQYHGKHTTIVPPAVLATAFPKQSLLQKAVNPFISARRHHSAGLNKEAGNVDHQQETIGASGSLSL